jgi:diadenylate cyclase
MTEVLGQLRWQDGLDISIIWYLIYRLLQMLRGSRAMQMIIGLAVVLMAYVLSRGLGLFTLNWILDNFLASIILVIIVIFQSVDAGGNRTPFRRRENGAAARGHH